MTLLDEAVRGLRGAGVGAVREAAWHLALKYGASLEADPVVEADWDLLVVLDACRADLWAEVVDHGDELPVGSSRIAPGGTSTEWLDAVFGREPAELANIGYVTANPYSATHVDGSRLAHLEEVWRTRWDDGAGTVEPRAVTDAAVRAARGPDPDRLIVHYMQPHFPSLADDRDDGVDLEAFGTETLSVWEDLRFGRRTRSDVWRAYRENLEVVLEDVRLLLSNVDADRAVITADHGNAMGERSIYGHAEGLAHRPLREVPWAVTAATDRHTYQPEAAPDAEATGEGVSDAEVTARLRELGYR
jgi:hypothetical protein